MIKSTLLATLGAIALDLAQSTWFGPIAILGATPDLALLFLVWTAYRSGPIVGSATAFMSGLVQDSLSAAPLGYSAFLRTMVTWIAGLLHGSFSIDRLLLPLLLGAAATLLKAASSLLLRLFFGDAVKAYDLLAPLPWVEMVYNALLAPLAFLLFSAIGRLVRKRPEGE